MSRKILAISGRAESGKSTLRKQLVLKHFYDHQPFAKELKEMLTAYLHSQGLDDTTINRMLDGDLKNVPTEYFENRTPRYAMQTLGTEWRDLLGVKLWVNSWNRRLFSRESIGVIEFVIDDLRFPHELERVRFLGGKVISLIRGEDTTFGQLHDSERHFTSIIAQSDIVIVNDMTPEDMLHQVETFFGDWL